MRTPQKCIASVPWSVARVQRDSASIGNNSTFDRFVLHRWQPQRIPFLTTTGINRPVKVLRRRGIRRGNSGCPRRFIHLHRFSTAKKIANSYFTTSSPALAISVCASPRTISPQIYAVQPRKSATDFNARPLFRPLNEFRISAQPRNAIGTLPDDLCPRSRFVVIKLDLAIALAMYEWQFYLCDFEWYWREFRMGLLKCVKYYASSEWNWRKYFWHSSHCVWFESSSRQCETAVNLFKGILSEFKEKWLFVKKSVTCGRENFWMFTIDSFSTIFKQVCFIFLRQYIV